MELAFAERELRALCLNEQRAALELGSRAADKLKRRLADLSAVSAVSELFGFPGSPRQYHADKSQFVIDLVDDWQLFFESGHVKIRMLDSGEIDWARTKRIKILRLEKQP